ncbi:MAG: I78 family peptidase inhibitor [Pseudomonadota bacterium]
MRVWLALLASLAFAACGSAPSEGENGAGIDTDALPPPAQSEADDAMVQPEWDALDRVGADTCGMRVVRGFLGRPASDIPEARLPEIYRILAPTDQATMDYIQTRLNVLTDEDGTVIGFKCG